MTITNASTPGRMAKPIVLEHFLFELEISLHMWFLQRYTQYLDADASLCHPVLTNLMLPTTDSLTELPPEITCDRK